MRSSNSNIFVPFFIFCGYPGETKITQFDIPVLINQQIRALEIAMKHIFLMEVGHAERDVLADANQSFLA